LLACTLASGVDASTGGKRRRRPKMAIAIPTTAPIPSAIAAAHEELDRVRQIKKCSRCECLLDVLEAIGTDLAHVNTAETEATRADFRTWWQGGNVKRHRCPGCEPCLPIAPYNQLNAALTNVGVTTTPAEGCAGGSCTCGSGTCATPSESAHEERGRSHHMYRDRKQLLVLYRTKQAHGNDFIAVQTPTCTKEPA
jgi:hypothetical protein